MRTRPLGALATAATLAAGLAVACLGAGCGRSKPAAAKDAPEAPPNAAAKPPAPTTWANRPEPSLRALQTALEAVDPGGVRAWEDKRRLPRPEDVSPEEPPVELRAAVDALIAWDGSGALAPIGCVNGLNDSRRFKLMLVARSALLLSQHATDPAAHAALRMSLALRDDQNDPLAMLIGAGIIEDAAKQFAVPAPFALADDLPWRVVASNARCVNAALDEIDLTSADAAELAQFFAAQGKSPQQGLADEKAAVKAFWATTMEQVGKARTRAELLQVLEARIDEARKERATMTSLLVPLLGPPFAAKQLVDDDEPPPP